MKNKVICTLLWNHLYLNNEGYFLPCCNSNEKIEELKKRSTTILENKSLDNIHTLDFIKEIRTDMLNGKKNIFCNQCYEAEEKGILSYREINNDLFSDTYKELISGLGDLNDKLKFEYVDLRLGNTCNLSCRMCPAESSSNLIKDLEVLEGRTFTSDFFKNTNWYKEENFWNNLLTHSDSFKKIYLAGGEPLLINETWDFLLKLIEKGVSKNITLYYSTNLTILPKKAYEIWPHFKKVNLSLSIDATEETYEYIRFPAKWSKVDLNLKELDKKFHELNIESAVVYTTIQAYNYASIPKLVAYLSEFSFIDHYPILNILRSPDSLAIDKIPKEIRHREVRELKKVLFKASTADYKSKKWKLNFVNELISYIEELKSESTSNIEDFKKYTVHFDKSRKQSIFNIIPELKNYF
ncbi:conserved hypothetical protein [Halobacteriovorax marinus SJ]|uniref:Radical SAM core domain-containing protein n=1 Tax=Halobacteriovorax marinus (strain ATCC BAA-682 / DSM 15412 / SJ) TaxID=862908 RepID=E1WZU2_HALMS|nr:twitch domain-containing radical SAM protein [Halobacteriovorax marinus]CBW27878.1 conserved hypothetical protein [Halobacteriovorax marinus SJ]